MAMSGDEIIARFAVELAWFREHYPDPDRWLDEHGDSPQSVYDYVDACMPKARAARP